MTAHSRLASLQYPERMNCLPPNRKTHKGVLEKPVQICKLQTSLSTEVHWSLLSALPPLSPKLTDEDMDPDNIID